MSQDTRTAPSADLIPPAPPTQDADPRSDRRTLSGHWMHLVQVLGAAYALYYLVTAYRGIQSPQAHRGLYVMGVAVLIFLTYGVTKKRARNSNGRVPWYDALLAALAAVVFGYFVLKYPEMVTRAGAASQSDLVMGVLAVLIALEITRRATGWILTGLGLLAILYTFEGPRMPGLLRHGGYSLERFSATMYTSFNGVFGVVADIFATYVFLFIIFGVFLQRCGAAQFFVDLPYALAGRLRGGPAKVAVLVSAFMGSINGSAAANVMTTGVFTIPLMKRTGYKPAFAGGVEAAASTGGGLLPPVMGAGVFLLAEFTGTPYSRIIAVSIIPAIMYFAAVYWLVDFQALKEGLRGLSSSELERPLDVFKRGWFYFLPIAVVFGLIGLGYGPAYAALWGVLACILIGQVPYRGRRMRPREYYDALWQSSLTSLSVGAIVGTIGIVIGVLNLTGLGLKFADVVIQASGGSLLVALILVTVASWVLGAGLTVTSSYVIVAILCAPALVELGLDPLVAHLIIFWVSQDANVTPPICVAGFAAASIAESPPMRTGWEAWKLARGLYIVPFLMAYSELIGGTWQEVSVVTVTGLLGIYGLMAAMSGFLRRRLPLPERLVVALGGALLIYPGWITNLVGAVLLALVYGWQRIRPGVPPAAAAPSADPAPSGSAEPLPVADTAEARKPTEARE
jgi:TRAP transporter 4TM/12TM fusion protein